MKKTAVIYDKWLSTLGGGEVVACNIARLLSENQYEVIFICGNWVELNIIREKLAIDLSEVKFIEIWNDEEEIIRITKGKDIFINASYMDYTVGAAKKNYYYASFPTKGNENFRTFLYNNIILPIASKYIKPIEFTETPKKVLEQGGNLLYQIQGQTNMKFSYLTIGGKYLCKFSIYYPLISKFDLEKTQYQFIGGTLDKQYIKFDHQHNVLNYELSITAHTKTLSLIVHYLNPENKAYLINPRIVILGSFMTKMFRGVENRLTNRLRAGYFNNVKQRTEDFDMVFSHSYYISKWIKKYWGINAEVLYPPVEMLFEKYKLSEFPKEKRICSVGRFFTLGHGKKQEIMIQVFKMLFDSGIKDFELHLAGGLGTEPSSIEYMKLLKTLAMGYPIYFHVNSSRDEIEKLYLSSSIYWHAAGFGENKAKDPINFEHFGIAPVEAISAGCIPVLFDGGGLPEIIDVLKLNKSDFLFSTKKELFQKTKKIILEKIRLSNDVYKLANKNFSISTFRKIFLNLIS